ncbi:hypothetical protein PV327_008838 [Microctonus hyperodae]|uniref:Uncharacterized protein n=1 Tax=Microctonus hyperodae TaxID=165561 RepID=A0AA39FTL1_MICHY|nr:hypothetical protein PV327_008838 [Microctonus hyperodae]
MTVAHISNIQRSDNEKTSMRVNMIRSSWVHFVSKSRQTETTTDHLDWSFTSKYSHKKSVFSEFLVTIINSAIIDVNHLVFSRASILTSARQSHSVIKDKNNQPIYRRIEFFRNALMSGWWSTKSIANDPLPEIFVLDYKEYADTFEEFERNYPTFILKTHCVAVSDSTFGDVANRTFDKRSYQTSDFIADRNGYYDDFVNAKAEKFLAHSVSANIKIGFLKKDTKLYLLPYMNGELISHGAYKRYLWIET